MFYASFTRPNGTVASNLYHRWEDFSRDTFSPKTKNINVINFWIPSRNYQGRKAQTRAIALRFQTEHLPGLSWDELAEIMGWFHKKGAAYGLLREFRENGICE